MSIQKDNSPIDQMELVEAALQDIAHNYREASLSNIAAQYGVSLAYVSESVRRVTGKNYKALLQKRRIEVAARLLRRGELSVETIIDRVGYKNSSYFYRLFYARYGQTPRDYRRTHCRVAPTGNP